jgi:Anti-sigma-K factor rskA
MTAMDHGAAHERIEELLLEPARLAGLDSSRAPEDLALREHLAGCPTCRADLEGWARLQAALSDALPGAAAEAGAALEPMEPPASLRARVLSAVRAEAPTEAASLARVPMAETRRRAWFVQPGAAWLGLAAALVVMVVGAGVLLNQAARLAAEQARVENLGEAVAAVDRILAEPGHRIVALKTQAGADAGSISWSRHDWVVLTSALGEPTADQRYTCWLENGSKSFRVGVMEFAGQTAYWVATVDNWKTWEIDASTRFVVSLEPVGAQTRTGGVVLQAALGAS